MVQVDGTWKFDAEKLAKSMKKTTNCYTNYTLAYQMKMNASQKSDIGHIKTLRSAVSDFFHSNGVSLTALALAKLTKWQKSRKRDDMAAKMRDLNPVKFSNARHALPYEAYSKIVNMMTN